MMLTHRNWSTARIVAPFVKFNAVYGVKIEVEGTEHRLHFETAEKEMSARWDEIGKEISNLFDWWCSCDHSVNNRDKYIMDDSLLAHERRHLEALHRQLKTYNRTAIHAPELLERES